MPKFNLTFVVQLPDSAPDAETLLAPWSVGITSTAVEPERILAIEFNRNAPTETKAVESAVMDMVDFIKAMRRVARPMIETYKFEVLIDGKRTYGGEFTLEYDNRHSNFR